MQLRASSMYLTLVTVAVQNSPGSIDTERMLVQNMPLDFTKHITIQMLQLPAAFAFQMQMDLALAHIPDVLITRAGHAVSDVPAQLAAFGQPIKMPVYRRAPDGDFFLLKMLNYLRGCDMRIVKRCDIA